MVKTIVAIGVFNQYRLPLLLDINQACEQLSKKGVDIRLAVISSFIEDAGRVILSNCPYIDIYSDPGHESLPGYLKGADILLLAEGFESKFVEAIELPISTKAHIFMFSSKPIILYAGDRTGVSIYAKSYEWAKVVSTRSVDALVEAIEKILNDPKFSETLIEKAKTIADKFHTKKSNQTIFIDAMLDDFT
jgi:glycosyltransferase involved in cell wall biosynthesis